MGFDSVRGQNSPSREDYLILIKLERLGYRVVKKLCQ